VTGGIVMIALGIGVKAWAAFSLGSGAYYWEDFFLPERVATPEPPGPYRYLKNPMYTLGYLHAYGFALVCGSWLGLIAAAFDQTAILIFHNRVEKPHFLRLTQQSRKSPPRRQA
jgi:protein-S-isoprenylcysteine O-methyltransferase Ste14